MKLLYILFKRYGVQTDRHGYTLFGVEIEHHVNIKCYSINY